MIKQARSYMAGAVSATAVIAIAVVAFVVLVSLQALQDWPLAKLGGETEQRATLSDTRPAPRGGTAAAGGTAADDGGAPEPLGSEAAARASVPPDADASIPSLPDTPADAAPRTGGGGSQSSGSTSSTSSASPPAAAGQATGPVQQTANDTVTGVSGVVDEAAAGTTGTVDRVVTEVAGPSSTVGRAAGEVTDVAGGLLGGGR